jgi:hypothetical protein
MIKIEKKLNGEIRRKNKGKKLKIIFYIYIKKAN